MSQCLTKHYAMKMYPLIKHHAMNTYLGNVGITPRIINLSTRGGKCSSSRSGCFTPGIRTTSVHGLGGKVGSNAGNVLYSCLLRHIDI